MKICEFTMPEIRYLLAECNFTEDERTLFDMRCVDVPLEECAERMNVSLSTVNRLNKRIKQKVDKIYQKCYTLASGRIIECFLPKKR